MQTDSTIAGIPADMRRWLARYSRPGVPKYVALRDAIVAFVASGTWPGGSRLPTESEWTEHVPLSLGTIQRAMRMLVDEGLIVRRPGQGSFVARRDPHEMSSPLHCRFVDDSGGGYLPVYSKVIDRTEVRGAGPWSRHLQPAGAVVRIDRVLDINNEFTVYSRFYVDPARAPAFASLPMRKLSGENFKEVIWRESHQMVDRMVQHMSTIALPADAARAMHRRPQSRASLLEVEAFLGSQSPIYYQELYIPPTQRRLRLAGD